MTKKVVIVIVEGDSDESLLIGRLRRLYGNLEVRFESQQGDILYHSKKSSKIKKIIEAKIAQIMRKRKYLPSDILAVIHIADTDGVLIGENKVRVQVGLGARTRYTEGCILVDSDDQRHNIIERNHARSNSIDIMRSLHKISDGQYFYQLYYFSRHLEHVVFNKPNPESKYKHKKIKNFVAGLKISVEAFLARFEPEYSGTNYRERYFESWEHIFKDENSLKRFTNVPLMFEFIDYRLKEVE